MGTGFVASLSAKTSILRSQGVIGSFNLIHRKIFKPVSLFLKKNITLFNGKGIEIGGPSGRFRVGGINPVYLHASSIDNVNFSDETKWEGSILRGKSFEFNPQRAAGLQFVHEAGDLSSIKDATYDFLISSHMLEHSANPIKVLLEWKRVIKDEGTLLLVLPHKDGTFDQFRPITKLSHIVDDYIKNINEDDRTHLPEILKLHDLKRDPGQKSIESFRAWIEGNLKNRGAHHHVFNSLLAANLVSYAGFEILCIEPMKPYDITIFARKPLRERKIDNSNFLKAGASYLRNSRFKSDLEIYRE